MRIPNRPRCSSSRHRRSRPDLLLLPSPSTPTFDRYSNTLYPVSSTPTRTGNRKPLNTPDTPTPTSSREQVGKRSSFRHIEANPLEPIFFSPQGPQFSAYPHPSPSCRRTTRLYIYLDFQSQLPAFVPFQRHTNIIRRSTLTFTYTSKYTQSSPPNSISAQSPHLQS